jgi:cyclic pyranopterin phosphate synthase
LKRLLRGGASDEEIADEVRAIIAEKEPGHRINEPDFTPPSRTMVFIGG